MKIHRKPIEMERPSGATSWKPESVKRVRNRGGVYEVVFDQCTFGLFTEVPSCSCTSGVSSVSDPSVIPPNRLKLNWHRNICAEINRVLSIYQQINRSFNQSFSHSTIPVKENPQIETLILFWTPQLCRNSPAPPPTLKR